MSVAYKIVFYTPAGARLGEFLRFSNLTVTRRENHLTWLKFEAPGDLFEGSRRSWLKPRARLAVMRSSNGGPFKLLGGTIFLLLNFRHRYDGARYMLDMEAATASYILGDGSRGRIVAYHSDVAEGVASSEEIDAIAKRIIEENLGASGVWSLADHLSIAPTITGATPAISMALSWTYVRRILDELVGAAATGGVDWFYDVIPEDTGDLGGKLLFKTWIGLIGAERQIVFSQERGNVGSVEFADLFADEVNHVYAAGKGQGSARLIAQEIDTDRVTLDPFARQIGIIHKQDAANTAMITPWAERALAAGVPRRIITVEIADAPGSRFMQDWDYGDRVNWRAGGESGRARVAAVVIDVADGRESIRAYLTEARPMWGKYAADRGLPSTFEVA